MAADFRTRVLAAVVGGHERVSYSSQKIMCYGPKSSDCAQALCLAWSPKFHNQYFAKAGEMIACVIMVLARFGMLNDIIVSEIVPRMFEVRLQLMLCKFYSTTMDDAGEAECASIVVAGYPYDIGYGKLIGIEGMKSCSMYQMLKDSYLRLRLCSKDVDTFARVLCKEVCVETHNAETRNAKTHTKILIPMVRNHSWRVFATDDSELMVDGGCVRFRNCDNDFIVYTRCWYANA